MIQGNLSDQVLCGSALASDYRWGSRAHLLRFFGALALAGIGFVVTCGCLHLLIPHPISLYAEIRSEKIALAKRWAPHTSVAAFGSSHVDCGFDPRSFDESFAPDAARPISLNLGVSGGSQIEQAAMAREYERLVAAYSVDRNPHLLLMEVNNSVNFTPQFMTHPRAINIYDANALRLALQFADLKLGPLRALGRSVVAIFDSVLHFMNVGMLSNQIFRPPLNAAILKNQTLGGRRGLSPPNPSTTDPNDVPEVNAVMANLKAESISSPAAITPGLCSEARILLDNGEASGGYRVIYIVTPKLGDLLSYDTYPSAITCGKSAIPIINVALPREHPELYDPGLWHDIGHLNEQGAAVYSRLLAQAIRLNLDPSLWPPSKAI